jgi:hypothetical protein
MQLLSRCLRLPTPPAPPMDLCSRRQARGRCQALDRFALCINPPVSPAPPSIRARAPADQERGARRSAAIAFLDSGTRRGARKPVDCCNSHLASLGWTKRNRQFASFQPPRVRLISPRITYFFPRVDFQQHLHLSFLFIQFSEEKGKREGLREPARASTGRSTAANLYPRVCAARHGFPVDEKAGNLQWRRGVTRCQRAIHVSTCCSAGVPAVAGLVGGVNA